MIQRFFVILVIRNGSDFQLKVFFLFEQLRAGDNSLSMLDADVKRLRSVIIGDVEVGMHQLAPKVIVSNQPDEIRMRENALRQRHHFEFHVIGVSGAGRTAGFPVTFVAFQFAETGSVIARISRRTRRVDAFVVAASVEADTVGAAIDVLFQTFVDVDAGAFVLV